MPIFRYNETAGNYYAYLIEGHGDDANDGLTPETAVATLDRLVEILDTYAGGDNRVAVIKKNIVNEGITYSRTSSRYITFDFLGNSITTAFKCKRGDVHKNLVANGVGNINNSTGSNDNVYPDSYFIYENCYFNNITFGAITGYSTNVYLKNCVALNCIMFGPGGSYPSWQIRAYNSVIINLTASAGLQYNFSNIFALSGCIINGLPPLRLSLITNKYFDYNCIIGNISVDGSIVDQNGLIALGYNLNGFSENPQFTDEAFGVYTVKSFSPCLYRGLNASHIGLGEGFYLTASQLLTNAETNDNFQVSSGRLTFIDPNDNALLQTYPIDAGSFVTIERAELAAIIGTVGADISSTAVVLSHWYPAYNSTYNYHTGAGITDSGIKYKSLQDNNLNQAPATETLYWERMTWESGVSYSSGKIVEYTDGKWYKANTATSTSWVAGEWDEVVLIQQFNFYIKTGRTYDECNDADYSIVPFNDTPLIDVSGKGNSEDDYDPDTGASITFRFISIKIHAKTVL